MDFITLATEHRRLLRALDEMLGDDNDDRTGSSATAAAAAGVLGISDTPSFGESSGMDAVAASRPVFSKNAEAELYMLATNFLLYVALVIVVILVCRIYFPEALVSRDHQPRPRNYNYRVAEAQEVGEEDYGSDDEEEALDSGEDDAGNPRAESGFFDFQQESLSRKQVLQRLIFCCIMLNVTFVMWGALQVRCRLGCSLLERVTRLILEHGLKIFACCVFAGTHVDASLPSLHGRVFYLLVRVGLYESLLDAHHVGNAHAIPQAASKPIDSHLRVLLSIHFQHAFKLVPVRSSSIRFFSCDDALQVLQASACHGYGENIGEQELPTVRLCGCAHDWGWNCHVHDVYGRLEFWV